MNPENSLLEKADSFSNDILTSFIVKSKNFYPNLIIDVDSNGVNIALLKKFSNNKYSFEYEEAIKLIFDYLNQLKSEFEFSEIRFHEKTEYGFNPSFTIKVPQHIPSERLNDYSEKLFEKVDNFAESNNIDFILDDLSIILCR